MSSGDDVGVGEQSPAAKAILTPSVELGERDCVILFFYHCLPSMRYSRAGWFVAKYVPQIIPQNQENVYLNMEKSTQPPRQAFTPPLPKMDSAQIETAFS